MKQKYSLVFLLLCLGLLLVMVSACGTPTTSATGTPPSGSARLSSALASVKPASARMSVYTDPFYTISYPQGWTVRSTNHEVTFTDLVHGFSFSVQPLADPESGTPPPDLARTTITGEIQSFIRSVQHGRDQSITPTVKIHGVTWQEAAATGDGSVGGQQINEQMVALGTNHLRQRLVYTLVLLAPTDDFGTAYAEDFQLMLRSLTFRQ